MQVPNVIIHLENNVDLQLGIENIFFDIIDYDSQQSYFQSMFHRQKYQIQDEQTSDICLEKNQNYLSLEDNHQRLLCLSFANTAVISAFGNRILGSNIQQNFHIEIDVGNSKVGFAPGPTFSCLGF
jgi:hypothetical protein